jgi:hypothetical protein
VLDTEASVALSDGVTLTSIGLGTVAGRDVSRATLASTCIRPLDRTLGLLSKRDHADGNEAIDRDNTTTLRLAILHVLFERRVLEKSSDPGALRRRDVSHSGLLRVVTEGDSRLALVCRVCHFDPFLSFAAYLLSIAVVGIQCKKFIESRWLSHKLPTRHASHYGPKRNRTSIPCRVTMDIRQIAHHTLGLVS